MPASSAAQGASDNAMEKMHAVIAFYNITWDNSRFNQQTKHENTLSNDLRAALDDFNADAVLLSECGQINYGLTPSLFLPMLRGICGTGFHISHQSHYTSIVRESTMEITVEPSLKGPLTTHPGHEFRMCQHLQVRVKDSVAKPIDIFNVHSPSSAAKPLIFTVRGHILKWFLNNMKEQTIIGGDLNTCPLSLDHVFQQDKKAFLCFEEPHLHGDISIVRGLNAESVPCDIQSTSKTHRMCVVMVTLPRRESTVKKLEAGSSLEKPPITEVTPGVMERIPKEETEETRGPGKRAAESVVESSSMEKVTRVDIDSSPEQEEETGGPEDRAAHSSADKPATPAASVSAAVVPFPEADAIFKAVGDKVDAGEEERALYGPLAQHLWKGTFVKYTPNGPVTQGYASKDRFERMLNKAKEIRRMYHLRLFNNGAVCDTDIWRSLTEEETALLHNAWMNDVTEWMTAECLDKYETLLREANELDRQKGKGHSNKGKSKAKRSEKGQTTGPRQQAQQLKKQRFGKVLNDLAMKKAFFFALVRHPSYRSPDGLRNLLQQLHYVMGTKEYKDMVSDSKKKDRGGH